MKEELDRKVREYEKKIVRMVGELESLRLVQTQTTQSHAEMKKNMVKTLGPIRASSESMTHCAVYQARDSINCVLHVHNRELWKRLLDLGCDSTESDTPYGTPQIAFEVATLIGLRRESSSFIVMAGHEDGIIGYGETISSAFEQILGLFCK